VVELVHAVIVPAEAVGDVHWRTGVLVACWIDRVCRLAEEPRKQYGQTHAAY
jgi:hypothetical protein